jgi:hypothetical protein
MSQFSNFQFCHNYSSTNIDIENYVNKMWDLSIKIAGYARWIAILDNMNSYNNNPGGYYNSRLIKYDNQFNELFNNIDDINYAVRARWFYGHQHITEDFKRCDDYGIVTKDIRDNERRKYYEKLEKRFAFYNNQLFNSVKNKIKSNGFDNEKMDVKFKVLCEPLASLSNRRIKRVDQEIVKITKKLIKHKDILSTRTIGRTLRHNQYFLIPNVILEGDFNDYTQIELDQLMGAYQKVIDYYKKWVIELYNQLGFEYEPDEIMLTTIEGNVGECCVCYEQNNSYTNCGHNLCVSCYKLIQNKICPICRTNLSLPPPPPKLPEAEAEAKLPEAEAKVEEFDGESKQIDEEVTEYYDTQYQELYDRFIIFTLTDELCDEKGDKYYKIYYKPHIVDLELIKLHPDLIRDKRKKTIYTEQFTAVHIKIN